MLSTCGLDPIFLQITSSALFFPTQQQDWILGPCNTGAGALQAAAAPAPSPALDLNQPWEQSFTALLGVNRAPSPLSSPPSPLPPPPKTKKEKAP